MQKLSTVANKVQQIFYPSQQEMKFPTSFKAESNGEAANGFHEVCEVN